MEEIVSKQLIISDDVTMQFHAVRSDADADGNDIAKTYARKDAVKALEEQGERQNETIAEVTDKTEEIERESADTKEFVKGVSVAQETDAENIEELKGRLEEAYQRIAELEDKTEEASHNKGAYVTEKALFDAVIPIEGDFAYVVAPTSSVEPATYWGDKYLGVKADNLEEWSNDARPANEYIYKGDEGVLFRVIGNVTVGTLVEEHHIEDSALLEDGIIEIVVLNNEGAYLYICNEDGVWSNTYSSVSITLNENSETSNVYDGVLTQETINLTARVNNIVANLNNVSLTNTINTLVGVVNELQRKAVFASDYDYVNLQKVTLGGYSVTGDLHKNLLGISPMPIILTATNNE